MTGFYKADLSDDVNQWEATSIVERIGTPEEHEDRFWRKGPYGVEQDSDGTFEAYVLVADTPFKIGGGFQSFQEAVMFLTSSMESKTVPETPEEKAEQREAEQREAVETEGEKAPSAPAEADDAKEDAKDQEDADEPTETTEKACDGDMTLGPEANGVGKSADSDYKMAGAIGKARALPFYIGPDGAPLQAPENIRRIIENMDPAEKRRIINENPEAYSEGWNRAGRTADAAQYGMSDSIQKSLDGADDSEGTHKEITPPHPEDVNERHYIDNHTLGKARLMADAPSLDAFEKSVGDFRSLMAHKNMDAGKMYSDSGDPIPFVKADESTSFEDMASFEKVSHSSPRGKKGNRSTWGGEDLNKEKDLKNRNPKASPDLQGNRHARETHGPIVGKGPGQTRDLYNRTGWRNKTGSADRSQYGNYKRGDMPISEYEGENISRGPAAQAHWDPAQEHFVDPEAQKRRADSLLQGQALRQATNPNRPFEPNDGSVRIEGVIGTGGYGKKPVKVKPAEEPVKPKTPKTPVAQRPRVQTPMSPNMERLGDIPMEQANPSFRTNPAAQKAAWEQDYRAQMEARYAPKPEVPENPSPAPTPAPEPPEAEESAADEFDRLAGTKKADDDPSVKPFREMLEFEKSKKEEARGTPFSGLPMQGSRPFRELYRTVHMGGDRYDVRADVFDPEMHKTDSESRKL